VFFREVSHNVGVMVQFRTLLQGPNEVVGGDAFAIFAVAFFQCALVMRWCLGRECVTVDVHRFVCMCARVLVCVCAWLHVCICVCVCARVLVSAISPG